MSKCAVHIVGVEPSILSANDRSVRVPGIIVERPLLLQARQLVQPLDHLPLYVEKNWGIRLRVRLLGTPFTPALCFGL